MNRITRFSWVSSMLLACLLGCKSTDIEAQRTLLMATDREFSEIARTAGEDYEKVLHFWTDDAVMLFSGSTRRAEGKNEIVEFVRRVRSAPGFSVEWTVERCDVAASGDFGYTWGTGRVTQTGADGTTATSESNYVVVWRKQADGRWRIVVDG